jgi:uncharacterized protein
VEPRLPSTDEDRRCEVLDEDACRRLLGTTGTGRIGFTDGAVPAILPVPFAVQDGHVMIPERRGSPVESALRGAVVAFQVDSFDTGTRTGWSVTVVGLTRLVSDPRDVAALELRLSRRPSAPDRCYIAVQPGLVRGWRMSEVPPVATSGSEADGEPPGR